MSFNQKEQRPPSDYDVYINLFGKFEVTTAAGSVTEGLRAATPWLLLKYLLIHQGCEVSLDELVGTVWPEDAASDTGSAVRVRLTRLRSFLDPIGLAGKQGLVIHHRLNFTLNPDYIVRTDADEFDKLLAELRRTPVEDARGLALCMQALELYRGPYLQYTNKDFWFESIQESYQKDFCFLAFNTVDRINITENSESLSLLSQRVLAFGGNDLELHRAVLACLGKYAGNTAQKRYVTQLMRSGFVADWLSAL